MNIPNFLTILRITSPFFYIIICLFVDEKVDESMYIFIIFFILSFTDFFDGYVARKYNMVSLFGKVFDPVSDKILVCCSLFYLVSYDNNILYPSMIIILREFIVSGIREYSIKTRLSLLSVTFLSKLKTCLQFFSIGAFLIRDFLYTYCAIDIYQLGLIGLWITTILTLYTGFKYANKFKMN